MTQWRLQDWTGKGTEKTNKQKRCPCMATSRFNKLMQWSASTNKQGFIWSKISQFEVHRPYKASVPLTQPEEAALALAPPPLPAPSLEQLTPPSYYAVFPCSFACISRSFSHFSASLCCVVKLPFCTQCFVFLINQLKRQHICGAANTPASLHLCEPVSSRSAVVCVGVVGVVL